MRVLEWVKIRRTQALARLNTAPIADGVVVPHGPLSVQRLDPGPSAPGSTLTVVLPNGVEMLLPGSDPEAFDHYVRRLEKTGTFVGARASLKQLATMSPQRGPVVREPLVGIVANDPRQLTEDESSALQRTMRIVRAFGCRPVVIPPRADLAIGDPGEAEGKATEALVAQLDGLIGLGGADVHPWLYGERNRHAVDVNYPRDRFEAALIRRAFESRVAMFGICRSHQLWNVVRGGDLFQDVCEEGRSRVDLDQRNHGVPLDEPFVIPKTDDDPGHENRVRVKRRSRMFRQLRRHKLLTNAAHHQAVRRRGVGLRVVAESTEPGAGKRTIQATEDAQATTVQFHPEFREDSAPDLALLKGVCRRAQIFFWVKTMEREGSAPSVAAITKKMMGRDFSAEDYRWARSDLPELLLRTR